MKSIVLVLMTLMFSLGAQAESIMLAEDLALDAQNARAANKPIVLFVTADHCPYCEQLRDEYFKFSPGDERFILRELVLDENPELVGFSGEPSTHKQVAAEYDIWLTPTVVFVGADGQQLTDPIVGVLTMDFYHYYFEKALGKSIDNLNSASLALQ